MTIVMLIVVLAAVVAVAVPVMKTLARRRKEQKLLDNPPEMIAVKVRVTGETAKSNIKATHFFERLALVLPNDDKLVENNQNVVHLAYVVKGAGVGRQNHVTFMVWCHPDMFERVALALSESYPDEVEITEVKPDDDPLGSWVAMRQAREEYEERLRAQASDADERDDEDDD